MKVKLFKREDGHVDVMVKRTLLHENPSRSIMNVAPEDVERAVAQLVGEMYPPDPQSPA